MSFDLKESRVEVYDSFQVNVAKPQTNNDLFLTDILDTPTSISLVDNNPKPDFKISLNSQPTVSKPRRKRKTLSCEVCRKAKVKCRFLQKDVCERCDRLRLSCNSKVTDIDTSKVQNIEGSLEVLANNVSNLFNLHTQNIIMFDQISKRLDALEAKNLESVKDDISLPSREDELAPSVLIEKVRSALLQKPNMEEKTKFEIACDLFIHFYSEHEKICLDLSKEFLDISHYYIIPGGISIIDKKYVCEHPLITCVFVNIALMLSADYKNSQIHLEICSILKKMISCINEDSEISDHDIEAILYACMYDIGTFDKWILSSIGIMRYFLSIDASKIIKRVGSGIFTDDDLFHLRIFNALSACHLRIAIETGRSAMYDENHWLLHETTVKFPNATVGDAIQVAQVELFRLFTKVLEQQNKFFIDSFNFEFDGSNVLRCKRLEEWRTKWEKIIDKDVSRICMYSYLFICVLMIEKYQHLRKEKVIMSSIHYASYVLILFTSTTSEFVRGLPMLQINGIVYVCVVLFKDLEFMDIQTREATIKLIFRTYWNLHKMGQKTNDAIATIANIICKLVELAQQNRKLSLLSVQEDDVSGLSNNTSNTASGKEETRDFVGSGSVTNSVKYMGHDRKRRKSQQQTKLSYEDLPLNTSSVPRDNGTPLDLMQLLQTPNSSLPINVDDTQLEQLLSNLPETLPSLNTIFSPQG